MALSIAGSDSSAAAGSQADLKTFSALGVYGASVITAVTAQNTQGITAIHLIPGEIIAAQIEAVFSDLNIRAVKTGMLASEETILASVRGLELWGSGVPVVVDPVMVSSTGSRLIDRVAETTLSAKLIPRATLLTPNLYEAAVLLNSAPAQNETEMKRQAERLMELGPASVLLKGGHGAGQDAVDIFFDGEQFRSFSAPRIETKNTRGTGCTLASAIAAFLAKGLSIEEAISNAKIYVHGAIARAGDLDIGKGPGPVSHFYLRTSGT